MELPKLKSRRTGNRSAVTRLLRKFADAKESSEFDREELIATYENLQDSPEIVQTSYTTPSLPQSNDAARILTETGQIATSILTPSYAIPSAISSNHRLPKLILPTFNGNILEWQSFWDSYESAVHYNPTLTDVQKFNYLKAQLENEAAQTIAGFSLTNANYAEAVNVLIERFGQTHKITQAHLQALLAITPPQDDLISLRMFYDKMESLVRGLESLGQTQDSYGN
ncbi:uncharacterized protein LOC134688131 [Mytilus trossulus]|uniref:uncharacterized protein LOC134688131 n=1 Tax=Mytilus trossulus TaxID=6551 RepID=UPI003006EB7D